METLGKLHLRTKRLMLALASLAIALPCAAQGLYQYPEADLALGERLRQEHHCEACHARRVGGNGHAIYKPQGRINTPGALRGMVEMCSVELKLQLFPEEITAIAAVLQRDHYRFAANAANRAEAPSRRHWAKGNPAWVSKP